MSDFASLMEAARTAGLPVSAPVNSEVPAVSGTGVVGSTLNCTMGTWTNAPTEYAYQWQGDGSPLEGTGADYVVAEADIGRAICCVVSATNGFGSGAAPPSNAVVAAAAAGTMSREAPSAASGERHRSAPAGRS